MTWGTRLMYVINAVLNWLHPGLTFEKYLLVCQPVPAQAPGRAVRRGAVEIRLLDHADPLTAQMPRPEAEIRNRLALHAVCLVAVREERCAGFIWLTQEPHVEPNHRCRFETRPSGSTSWDLDVYVAPGERGGMLFARLWQAANDHLRQRGVRWTFSRISAFNCGSLAAHGRLGMHVLQTTTFLTAGPIQLMLSNGAPWLHLAWNRRMAPTIVLNAPDSPPAPPVPLSAPPSRS